MVWVAFIYPVEVFLIVFSLQPINLSSYEAGQYNCSASFVDHYRFVPIPSPQSPVPNPQSPVPGPQSPVPSPGFPRPQSLVPGPGLPAFESSLELSAGRRDVPTPAVPGDNSHIMGQEMGVEDVDGLAGGGDEVASFMLVERD